MADASGIQPPYLDPSQYPNYADVQRKQLMAQMLMQAFQQNANSPNPQPVGNGAYTVQPKRGIMQGIAPILSAALAGKAMKDSNTAQQNYFQGLNSPAPAQTAPYDASAAAQADQAAPGIAATPQSQAPRGLVAPTANSGGMIPSGMSRGQAQQLLSMMGPEKYAEMVSGQFKPTDLQMQLRAAGIDPSSSLGRQMQQQMLAKSLNIAPIDVRAGGTLVDPITKTPVFSAPANGVQTSWGPDGQPSQSVVPGAAAATAAMTGADTAAKVANTPQTFPTGGGGSTVGYPGDVIGAPPALRGTAPAPGAAPAQPGSSQGPVIKPATAPPGAPQKPQAPGDPWATVPKLKVSNAVGAPDAFTEGTLKAAGEKHAALSTLYGEQSDLADQKLAYNAEARKALPAAEVGPMSEWISENRAKLKELGVPEKLIPGSGTITPTIELNKYLTNAALQGAKATFGARMTQNEVKLQTEEMSPSTSMTRDAIASLINQDDVKNQYQKQRSTDYGKYIDQKGDPLKFESWYSKNFPLTSYAQAQGKTQGAAPTDTAPVIRPGQKTSGATTAAGPTPDALKAEMIRRGLIKQ